MAHIIVIIMAGRWEGTAGKGERERERETVER
jgi:hypothetical protein